MTSVVSIHQPGYLPWLGLVDKASKSDIFIVLDSVQFNKRAFQNRTLYSTQSGSKYLTIPCIAKGHQQNNLLIKDVQICDPLIFQNHYKTLQYRYKKSPSWERIESIFRRLAEKPPKFLVDATIYTLQETFRSFSINPELYLSSELKKTDATKSQLMLDLTLQVNGTTYLSGTGAKDYMDIELFSSSGIDVIYQDFTHPVYTQSHGGVFCEGCFALEALLEDPNFKL